MTRVPGDFIVYQNIMFSGKMEVNQALSFSCVNDIKIKDFHFVSQITVSDINS